MRHIFSEDNIKNLIVHVSTNRGGSFVIKAKQGGLVVISINKAEYQNLQKFVPDYYRHCLMNPNTLLAAILGIFILEITRDSETIPIHLIMMRDVQDNDKTLLEETDVVYPFDLKG